MSCYVGNKVMILSQSKIKYLCSLELKKNRIRENKIILDGERLIDEAINQEVTIEHIWISENHENKNEFVKKIKLNNINYTFEKEKIIKKISNTKNSQGIIALVTTENIYNYNLDKFDNHIAILDQISDPGNLGTILRTCAWFGINSIILTDNSVDIFNSKCIRSSMGGHFHIRNLNYLSYDEINRFLEQNSFEVFCADMNGPSLNKIKVSKKWALILGSEAHGVNKKLNYTSKICIPQIGKIESLNASVAFGILLNELIKKGT